MNHENDEIKVPEPGVALVSVFDASTGLSVLSSTDVGILIYNNDIKLRTPDEKELAVYYVYSDGNDHYHLSTKYNGEDPMCEGSIIMDMEIDGLDEDHPRDVSFELCRNLLDSDELKELLDSKSDVCEFLADAIGRAISRDLYYNKNSLI